MSDTRTIRLGVTYETNVGSPCLSYTGQSVHLGTFGPAVTFVSASISAGAPPCGMDPFVCPGSSSQLYVVGTPGELGVFTFTIDALMSDGSHTFWDCVHTVALVSGCPLITVTPATLDDVFVGQPIAIQFAAADGLAPYTWDVAELTPLPDGLALSAGGLLSGAATAAGNYTFTVRATDSNGCPGVVCHLALAVIDPPPVTVGPADIEDGDRDQNYTQTFEGGGGIGAPYTFAVVAGSLPPGLSLSGGGMLSGIPTLPGAYSFTIQATDYPGSTGERAYDVTIAGLRIDIDGVDRLAYIEQAEFDLGLNRRATAHLIFRDGFIPDRLADVIIYARDGVTAIFGGLILTRKVQGVASGADETVCDADCVDYSIYFDDPVITLSYDTAVAVEDVIADMVDQALGDYGLTYTPVATGKTMDPFSWEAKLAVDCVKDIYDKTGVVVRVLPDQSIEAFVPGSTAASVSITDADVNAFDLTWTDGARLTANTVELLCGPPGPGRMRQQWIADGVASSWVTDLPAIDPAPILVEIDDGVTPRLATVVPLGSGGGAYEWDRDTHTLSLGTDPLPAAGTIITLGSTDHFDSPFTYYTVQFPFKITVPSVPPTPRLTYRESRPDIVEYAAGLEIAEGLLVREGLDRRDLEITTDEDGFLPGQALPVDVSTRGGLDESFLVSEVRGQILNAEIWVYTVTAQQDETVYRGSVVDEWRTVLGGGSGGVASASAASITAPTASDVIHADGAVDFTADQSLGGFKLTDVGDPANPQDAATKAYVDAAAPAGVILDDGSVAFAADESMGGFALTDVADPVDPQDAATKAYVDAVAGAGAAPRMFQVDLGGDLAQFKDDTSYVNVPGSGELEIDGDAFDGVSVALEANAMVEASAAATASFKLQYWTGAAWADVSGATVDVAMTTAGTRYWAKGSSFSFPAGTNRARVQFKGDVGAAAMVSGRAWLTGTYSTASGGNITTADAFASRPAASADGNLFLPNDGCSLERDTGAAWEPWGPIFPFTVPSDTGFSWVNQGSSTLTAAADALVLRGAATSGASNLVARVKTAPSTPYTVTAHILATVLFKQYLSYGLVFRDSGSGKIVYFRVAGASTSLSLGVSKFTDAVTFSADYVNIAGVQAPWLRVTDNGANRVCSFSVDGQNWIQLHTVGRTDFLTADQVGFAVETYNNAAPNLDIVATLLSWKES